MAALRTGQGMRERSPGVWELIVENGNDPVSGRRRQVSRVFRGTARDAKKERAALLVEVTKGHHSGTRATLDDLFEAWIIELRRKGRSPHTVHGYERVYERNIRPTLGKVEVSKITTKRLTDLYGAHQARGLAPRSVYQIHACLSSMFTQACRWGWRDSNPAQWAEPPALPNVAPVVATPAEIRALIAEAERSRRPEYARAILVAATTGLRRAELCALRRDRDVDFTAKVITVSKSVVALQRSPIEEIPTKNRRVRKVAIDDLTASMLQAQLTMIEDRARDAGVGLVADPYLFSDAADAATPWKPDSVSQYFGRLCVRAGVGHLTLHSLRKFMETYGQEMGYSVTQVALRAGHDPSVAARYYSGKVAESDRALADAVASLLTTEP
jgi:integrase